MNGEREAGSDRLDIDNMYLCGSRLTRVSLKDSEVRDAVMAGMRFEDVRMTGMDIENANLTGTKFHNVNLSDVTISCANLSNLAISDADLTGMTIDGILVSDLLKKWDEG